MPIDLPFSEYEFTFQAINKINLPDYNGTLWHSVLGKALHDLACIAPDSECGQCMFVKQCEYSVLFRGASLPHIKEEPRYKTIPTPHIFRLTETNALQVKPGKTFTIHMILVGLANEKVKTLLQAMQRIGNNGFGARKDQAKLGQVTQKYPLGYDSGIFMDNTFLQEVRQVHYPIPVAPETIRLVFRTPLKESGVIKEKQQFVVDYFLMMIIRRISLLQYFYTETKLDDDFEKLKQLTQTVPVLQNKMQRVKNYQLSVRKNQHQQVAGWEGYLEIDLKEHQELWAYLYLGQWLNVGKNANMGFGEYTLIG
jgi:hypothetical protein